MLVAVVDSCWPSVWTLGRGDVAAGRGPLEVSRGSGNGRSLRRTSPQGIRGSSVS